ncbi:MAG: hypothetical protein M5U34_35145 [Chloroflexi bacterium]|nr:hypothetical protein [Chloroflexota bacterium]
MREGEEFAHSHHLGASILGSLDNVPAEVVEGKFGMITPAFPQGNKRGGSDCAPLAGSRGARSRFCREVSRSGHLPNTAFDAST